MKGRKEQEQQSGFWIRLLCFLLIITSVVSVTFARYVSTTNPDPTVAVSPFATSFTIDKSNMSFVFDNAAYQHEGLVMNTPQITEFTVSNTQTRNGETVVSGVDLSYELVFYIPALFAQSASVQITTNHSATAVTPVYVLNDFLGSSGFVTGGGYGSIAGAAPQTFGAPVDGVFTATDGSGRVTVESVQLEANYKLIFTSYDSEVDPSQLPALALNLTGQVEYYKFTIQHRGLQILPGETAVSQQYQLRLVPTVGMSDVSGAGLTIDEDFNKEWANFEGLVAEDGSNLSFNTSLGDEWSLTWKNDTKSLDMTYRDQVYQNVFIKDCSGKSYPCRLNVLFTQASTVGS